MREIKFRAWDKEKKCYRTRDALLEGGGIRLMCASFFFVSSWHILEQYTGLKDKNGKEIYEGDVVQWVEFEGVVKFGAVANEEDTSWGFYTMQLKPSGRTFGWRSSMAPDGQYYEVIGNIHENAELLEEKQ